jgi:glycosyltransferase involved in cell wall biosynthesis
MSPIRLTHLFAFFRTLGGVESILRRHLARDSDWGIQSRIVALFDPTEMAQDRVAGLGLTWGDCIASTRRKFRRQIAAAETGVAVYHNAWGLPFLADLDGANRRLSLVHSDLPTLRGVFQSQSGLVDGILCVNDQLKSQAQLWLPNFDPDRIAVLPYPIAPGMEYRPHPPLRSRRIVCGYVGRVIKEQKRVDRLPNLIRTLEQSGLDFRFEILGDGPARPWLERQFEGNPRIHFHGRLEGERYWRALRAWDAIVFVSDYEGLPISLLEAMSLGVLPIYPRIESGGDPYAAKVHSEFLYQPGDLAQVAQLLKKLCQTPEENIQKWREACQALAAPHQGDCYERAFSGFVHTINDRPRISLANIPARPFFVSDYCPFAALRRFYYQGLFRRNDRLTGAIS